MNELEQYCKKWSLLHPVLIADTFTSEIYKVRFQNGYAVLKILNEKGRKFEVLGASVLRCFGGNGAVHLIDGDGSAHLLEFIDGQQLKNVVAQGNDGIATEVICSVIEKLHSYSEPFPKELISMERNFRSLFSKVRSEPRDSIYCSGAKVAEKLIETERELKVLHGDIHHENILESSARGWLAIDPQCLVGERTYDTANTFYNPSGFQSLVESKDTIERRCLVFSRKLELEQKRIFEYAFAYGCLSAAWCIEDGQSPDATLRIAHRIREILTRH